MQNVDEVARIKSTVRDRDGLRCVRCGLPGTVHIELVGTGLEVHRTSPGSSYSAEPGVCETLCKSCHAKQTRADNPKPAGTARHRLRIDLRIDPEIRARIEKQADRFGESISVYIRRATIERLERDEATDPNAE